MYFSRFFVLALFPIHVCKDAEGICQDHVERARFKYREVLKYEDKCYALSAWTTDFDGARKKCKTLNGDLARLSSSQLATFLSTKIQMKYPIFIGAIETDKSNEWEWLNGDPVTWTHWYNEEAISVKKSPGVRRCVLVVYHQKSLKWDAREDCFELTGPVVTGHYLCEFDYLEQTSAKPQTTEIPLNEKKGKPRVDEKSTRSTTYRVALF